MKKIKDFLEKYLPKEVVKRLPIIIAAFLLLVAASIFYLDTPRRRAAAEVRAASGRIRHGLDNIPVRTGGYPVGLQNFLDNSLGGHPRIDVYLNFEHVLDGVYATDFTTAWQERETFIDALYENVAKLFSQTDDLSVRVRNHGFINRFETIRDYTDTREFRIDIIRFLADSQGHFRSDVDFEVVTDYGTLNINSDFFNDDSGAHRIVFGLEQTVEDNPVIYLNIFDWSGAPLTVRNPGHNFRLAIPLTADIMRGFGGELLYDSVEYIGEGGLRYGDILDYFISNNHLYVYTNRSGRFRFVSVDEDATIERIRGAVDRIEVWADGTNSRLGDFRVADGMEFSEILVTIDFETILSDVRLFDFIVAGGHLELFYEDLYSILADLFERTDNLIIRERNAHRINDFAIPTEINANEFQIEVTRFMQSPYKFLRIDTHFGILDLYSSFLIEGTRRHGDPAGVRNLVVALEQGEYVQSENGYEDEPLARTSSAIRIQLRDSFGDVDVQYPGKSFLLTIPLDAPFMRYPNGELRYNAVEYICRDGIERGILPRSFIDGENLYIYANRTGTFRLTNRGTGQTTDRATFLSDRDINPSVRTIDGQTVITRGGFWGALMDIHWVENLFHPPPPPDRPQFPDLAINSDLNRQVWVGQSLDIFHISGYPCGNFIAGNPLRRAYLFRLLAMYIRGFSIEVEGLKPVNPNIDLPDNFSSHWSFNTYEFLTSIQFVPYDPNNRAYIDLYAYVTIEEAMEIIFMLITTHHFI